MQAGIVNAIGLADGLGVMLPVEVRNAPCPLLDVRSLGDVADDVKEAVMVAVELVERIARKDFKGNTLTLKIKFGDFEQITRSFSTKQPLVRLDDILPLAKKLLTQVDYARHPVRLIGLAVSNPAAPAPAAGQSLGKQLYLPFGDDFFLPNRFD